MFKKSIQKSIKIALEGNLLVFGILPSYPATGYGYIKSKNNLKNKAFTANKVQEFIEKPNLNKAKIYNKSDESAEIINIVEGLTYFLEFKFVNAFKILS